MLPMVPVLQISICHAEDTFQLLSFKVRFNNLQFSQRKSEVLIRISSTFQAVSATGTQENQKDCVCLPLPFVSYQISYLFENLCWQLFIEDSASFIVALSLHFNPEHACEKPSVHCFPWVFQADAHVVLFMLQLNTYIPHLRWDSVARVQDYEWLS